MRRSLPRVGPARARVLARAALAAMLVAAVARVAATYHVYSQTFDEPSHLAAGMEWLDRGTFTYEPMNPPLARVAVALGPYLDGLRSLGNASRWREGMRILEERGAYMHNLTLARLGVLPFLVLAVLLVWAWARRLHGEWGALAAVLLFTTAPPVLAHAGLATTDLPVAALILAALFAWSLWLERRTPARTVALGAAAALAVGTKLSALLYLPACGAAILAARWLVVRRRTEAAGGAAPALRVAPALALAAASGFVVLWAIYRFSVGRVGGVVVPFPELFAGIAQLRALNAIGQDAYLLGRHGTMGWWYFFPLTLALKTPLPFLLLAAAGIALAVRHAWRTGDWRVAAPAVAAPVVLLAAIPSHFNIGLRHILPLFPLAAIAAGGAVVALWRAAPRRELAHGGVAALLVWQTATSAAAHPDYLPWFNVLAGDHPEHIIVNADLDWGQDLLRLADTVRARHIDSLALAYFGSADPRVFLPHVRPLSPAEHPAGWFAVSEAVIQGVGFDGPNGFAWLDSVPPVAEIGKSIRLYDGAALGPRGARALSAGQLALPGALGAGAEAPRARSAPAPQARSRRPDGRAGRRKWGG